MRAVTLGTIALLHLTLAVAVWRARPNSLVNRLFALQTLTFAGWTLGNGILQTGSWLNAANVLTFASASLIPATLLTFTIHYPNSVPMSSIPWHRFAMAAGLIFAMSSLTTDWLVYDIRADSHGLSRQTGALYPLFVGYVVIVIGAGLTVFVRKWRKARERQRAQLNYYGFGLLVATGGGITSNLIIPAVTGNSGFSHLGPYFSVVLIALTAHTIIRHRFMDLRIVVHRGLTFVLAMVLSLLPLAALLLLAVHPLLVRLSLTEVEAYLTAGVCVGVALLIPPSRDLAERLLDRYVYRTRTNPQYLLRRASAELSRGLDLGQLTSVIVDTIQTGVEPEGLALYLKQGKALGLATVSESKNDVVFLAPLRPPADVMKHLISRRAALVRDEIDMPSDCQVREALTAVNWALVLPLVSDQHLVGLVAVGPKRSGDPFFSEDLDALMTLGNHAGSALRNAALYAQLELANAYVTSIVGAMQNGVVAVDTSETVTLLNPAAKQMLRLTPDVPQSIEPVPEELKTVLRGTLTHGRRYVGHELRLLARTGSEPLVLLCTVSPLYDHTGQLAGAVAVFSDLGPLKELDRERARGESFATLQRLTQMLAHEIGNPLVPIKTLTKLLPTRVGDQAFATDLSRIVSREIERIERLVARLSRLAPTVELSYASVDLRIPIQHAVEVVDAEAAANATRIDVLLVSS
ncbi:MAG TPA: histidine kinase N-terminal 7TM domain-containing protein, partial [Gemmatimonadaceae bacterium]|nr:histidine kinase N-terminal 7TM domain-containing protein [Gemmatimonadaceae bacterium]